MAERWTTPEPEPQPKRPKPLGISPTLRGTGLCLIAALGYSAVNALMRLLTNRCDLTWVLCVKESVAACVVGAWLVCQAMRGRRVLPSGKALALLVLAGLATQLISNFSQLWAMSVVGLAVTITINIGVNLVTCAILGRVVLGERVSAKSIVAMVLLMVSVGLLSVGAGPANQALAASAGASSGPLWVAVAIALCCVGGAIYGLLSVAIRGTLLKGAPLPMIVFIVPFLGMVSFAPISLWRQGFAGLLQTPNYDLAIMLAAGVLNLMAFAAIIKGLELMTVLHVNLINALQVALAAMAGFLFFSEPPSAALVLGVLLSVVGMVMIDRPATTERDISASEPV